MSAGPDIYADRLRQTIGLVESNGRVTRDDHWDALEEDLSAVVQYAYAAKATSARVDAPHWAPSFRARTEALIEQFVQLAHEAHEARHEQTRSEGWTQRKNRMGL